MEIISYTYMRQHLAEILDRMNAGEEFCITRRGCQPIVLPNKRNVSASELQELLKKNRKLQITRLRKKHAATLAKLADK